MLCGLNCGAFASALRSLLRAGCFEEIASRRLLRGGCSKEAASRRLLRGDCFHEIALRRLLRGGWFEEVFSRRPRLFCNTPWAHPMRSQKQTNPEQTVFHIFGFFVQPTRPLSDPPSIMPYETFPTDLVDTSGKVVARCWQVWSTSLKVSCKVRGHNRSEFIVRSNWFDSSDAAFACLLSWASRGHILDDVRTPFRGDHERQCNETR